MKKLIFLLFPIFALAQNPTSFPYGIKNTAATSNSTPTYFVTQETDGVHKKTPAAVIFNPLTGEPYNTNLYTDKIIIYGNSIETGAGAEPRSVYGWNVITPQILETKVDNYAISGTTLVKFFDGDNSGIDRLSIITPTYASTMRAYISGIGVNDMYDVNGTYNETNFRNAYYQLIDELVAKGWPLSKIYLFFPLTVNPNTSTMNTTISSIASIKGVNFINVKNAMDSNGGLSLVSVDGIHPNNAGHKVISTTIANTVTGTKYNYTQFHQDISTTGTIVVGNGISGGSGNNGLEIRGTNEVNKSGKISLFGDIYLDNEGGLTMPHSINFGSSSYATGGSNYNNSLLKFYYNTYIGVSSNDGLTFGSGAGSGGAKITFKNKSYFNDSVSIVDTDGAVTTPFAYKAGKDTYIGGAITTSNTTFQGYNGSGIGFSSSEGLALISGGGLTPKITLKNPTTISGTLSVTGNATIGSDLYGAETTPSFIDLGNSYANTTVSGSNLKLKLYSDTGFGIDGSNGLVLLSNAGGGKITSMSNHYFLGNINLSTPTTSVGSYDILTLNSSTGVVEKIAPMVTQTITNGVTTTSPSEDAVYDALALKASLSGEQTFTGQVNAGSFVTGGSFTTASTGEGLKAPNNGPISFICNNPSTPGWTANTNISATFYNTTVYTVATLPTTGVVTGSYATVSDALAPTYLTTVVGGGAIVAPVFYNGTNWVCH